MKPFLLALIGSLPALAQGLSPAALLKPPTDTWPTYNGDYSGRRFSDLKQINQSNVDQLKIEWMYRITSVGAQRGVGNPTIKSTPLLVDGIAAATKARWAKFRAEKAGKRVVKKAKSATRRPKPAAKKTVPAIAQVA